MMTVGLSALGTRRIPNVIKASTTKTFGKGGDEYSAFNEFKLSYNSEA
jgi:hypothetical protein